MAKSKTVYVCGNCGAESPKWVGRCNACGEWNSYKELHIPAGKKERASFTTAEISPRLLNDIEPLEKDRIPSGMTETDRILGGGIVPGSLILLGGEPGVGKSTLVLQMAMKLEGKKVLYVSGEESAEQIKLRAGRLGSINEACYIYSE